MTSVLLSPWPVRVPVGPSLLFLSLLALVSWRPLFAQDTAGLDSLIFEPVAIRLEAPTTGSNEENTGAAPEDGAPAMRVIELDTLPRSDQSRTPSEILETKAAAESVDEEALEPVISRFEQAVSELERKGGPFEMGLVEELLDQGDTYHELGEYGKAVETFDRAMHVERVNKGLFSLEQIPIIHKAMESLAAAGNWAATDQRQESLFYLQQKALGLNNPELAPALVQLADWNLFTYGAWFAPDLHFLYRGNPAFANTGRGPLIDEEEDLRIRRLINARNLYSAAKEVIWSMGNEGDPELLLDTEKKLALANYFFATGYSPYGYTTMGTPYTSQSATDSYVIRTTQHLYNGALSVPSNSMGYRYGTEALERRIDFLRNRPQSDPVLLARAWVDLGDWLLVFRKRSAAAEAYQEAFDILTGTGNGQAAQDLLSPAVPVPLPTIVPGRYSRAANNIPPDVPLTYPGYIDVSFLLDRFGEPRDIQVLGKSSDGDAAIENRLMRELRRSLYRPRFTLDAEAGGTTTDDLVHLRYYYTY